MNFSLTLPKAEERLCEFILELDRIGYSKTTLNGYRTAIRKAWKAIYAQTDFYSNSESNWFIKEILPDMQISCTYKKHIRTALRRWNDYLSNKPYKYRCTVAKEKLTMHYQMLLENYIGFLKGNHLKKATIDNYIFFATEFLYSLIKQDVTNMKQVTGFNIGSALASSGSTTGFCKKLPRFLKYLYTEEITRLDLSVAVPKVLEESILPAIYKKEELETTLLNIDCTTLNGKRDYAALSFLMVYGIRVTDLINLNISDINFIHDCFSFRQSKTENLYEADLLPQVKDSLLLYLQELKPDNSNTPLFQRLTAPFGRMSRSGIWNIVSLRLMNSVEISGRKHGSHALRSSLASNLILEDVPYDVVRKILGHSDPNATKRYAAIDVAHLRLCALECPQPTGAFKSYLEGGAWK